MAITARLEQAKGLDRRTSARRKISFVTSLGTSRRYLTIHDLSSTGMLIETSAKLPLFEPVQIDLPEAGSQQAIVVWTSGQFYGCEFQERLSKAAISATLLRSKPRKAEKLLPEAQPVPRAPRVKAKAVEHQPYDGTDEKASLTVRLRVIFGSAILLWALIIWAARSLLKIIT